MRGSDARARRTAACLLLVAASAHAEAGASGGATTRDDQVEVRGTLGRPASRDATAATTVVAGEELSAPGASSADVLARVPGVQVSRTGSTSDVATASIRGATSAQTPVYLAGIRLNDDVTGAADLSTLPLFMVDRVEVYRGNAPLDADRLGIGGAVFFEPRFPHRTELGGGVGAGSFGERSAWVSGAAASKRAATVVAVRREGAENDFSYSLDDGSVRRRTNADFTSTDAWTLARYTVGTGARVTAVLHAYDREQGSPGLAVIEDDRARTHTRKLLGAISARIPCGHEAAGAETCSVELVSSGISANATVTDPLGSLIGTPFVATTGERIEEQARVTAVAGSAWTFGGSVATGLERVRVSRPGDSAVRAERWTARPAATATWHAGATTDVTALGSVECHATKSAGARPGACDTPELGARLGARQRLGPSIELRANAGHYVRTPALGELYGISAVVRGNPTLLPEAGDTADLGVHVGGATGRLRADTDVFGFARRVDALVAYRQNFLGVIVPFNVGRARLVGVEVAASVAWSGLVRTALAATLLDPRDTSQGRTLANDILPFRSRLVVTDFTELYTDEGLPALGVERASVGVRVTHRSSRYADPGGLIVLGAQTVFDLEASAGFLHRTLGARLALRNALDAREVDAVGLPLPGRSVYATLEASWR
jgi:iron complex outermembrane receptor protein